MKKRLDKKITKVKSLHNAWTLFKIAVIAAQPKYFLQSKEALEANFAF